MAYVTALNQADATFNSAEDTAANTSNSAIATAQATHANALSTAQRARVDDEGLAEIALRVAEGNASITRAGSIATMEANWAIALAAQDANSFSSQTGYDYLYAAAFEQWVTDVKPDYVTHATALATADATQAVSLAQAAAGKNYDRTVAETGYNLAQAAAAATRGSSMANQNAADTAHQTAVSDAHVQRVMGNASTGLGGDTQARFNHAATVHTSIQSQAIAAATAARDYSLEIASAGETYLNAVAQAERNHKVAVAQADRNYAVNSDSAARTSAIQQADTTRKNELRSAKLTYGQSESQGLSSRMQAEANADNSAATTRINADLTLAQAGSATDRHYAQAESTAYATQTQAYAGYEKAYAISEASNWAAALSSFATSYSSPWASYDDYAGASHDTDWTVPASTAQQTFKNAFASVQSTAELAVSDAEKTLTDARAAADAAFRGAQASATLAITTMQASVIAAWGQSGSYEANLPPIDLQPALPSYAVPAAWDGRYYVTVSFAGYYGWGCGGFFGGCLGGWGGWWGGYFGGFGGYFGGWGFGGLGGYYGYGDWDPITGYYGYNSGTSTTLLAGAGIGDYGFGFNFGFGDYFGDPSLPEPRPSLPLEAGYWDLAGEVGGVLSSLGPDTLYETDIDSLVASSSRFSEQRNGVDTAIPDAGNAPGHANYSDAEVEDALDQIAPHLGEFWKSRGELTSTPMVARPTNDEVRSTAVSEDYVGYAVEVPSTTRSTEKFWSVMPHTLSSLKAALSIVAESQVPAPVVPAAGALAGALQQYFAARWITQPPVAENVEGVAEAPEEQELPFPIVVSSLEELMAGDPLLWIVFRERFGGDHGVVRLKEVFDAEWKVILGDAWRSYYIDPEERTIFIDTKLGILSGKEKDVWDIAEALNWAIFDPKVKTDLPSDDGIMRSGDLLRWDGGNTFANAEKAENQIYGVLRRTRNDILWEVGTAGLVGAAGLMGIIATADDGADIVRFTQKLENGKEAYTDVRMFRQAWGVERRIAETVVKDAFEFRALAHLGQNMRRGEAFLAVGDKAVRLALRMPEVAGKPQKAADFLWVSRKYIHIADATATKLNTLGRIDIDGKTKQLTLAYNALKNRSRTLARRARLEIIISEGSPLQVNYSMDKLGRVVNSLTNKLELIDGNPIYIRQIAR